MRLADWLEETRTTQQSFARAIGVTQGRVSQILKGAVPSFRLVRRIEQATDGRVTSDDFACDVEVAP